MPAFKAGLKTALNGGMHHRGSHSVFFAAFDKMPVASRLGHLFSTEGKSFFRETKSHDGEEPGETSSEGND